MGLIYWRSYLNHFPSGILPFLWQIVIQGACGVVDNTSEDVVLVSYFNLTPLWNENKV